MDPSSSLSSLVNGHGNNNSIGVASFPRFPSVESKVEVSTEGWARDLRALFDAAKERFGDVSWESEEGGDKVWGHKAVIYARAPKAFKDRYFISRPFSRSPTSLSSPTPHLLPPLFSSRGATTPPSSFNRLSPLPGRSSTLSVDTFQSEGTLRPSSDTVLRLTHGDTPELFQAQLEWLYTGEGFGDVVEWISAEDDGGLGGSIRDSLGRRGNIHERRDKLGQDLTYMWRSKLYADVRIHLDSMEEILDDKSDDSDESTDSLSSTASFTTHRFILVSRSPYFASVLLNPLNFSSSSQNSGDIYLPTPPFTPASLHFCLGWMYAGHLDFSNRSFDLTTAFQIHRAATYLQLDELEGEVESRIVWDFCHGLERHKCTCRRCPLRAARVWRFSNAPDVGAIELSRRAKEYVVASWAESWGREVGTADEKERKGLLDEVVKRITPSNVVAGFRSIAMLKARLDNALRTKGREAGPWVDVLTGMLETVQTHCRRLLVKSFAAIAEGKEMWDLVSGKGFNMDLLEEVGKELVDATSTATGCVEGPRIYQALVSAILLKVDPVTLQTALPARGRSRQQVEIVKEGILGNVKRRWMQIRDAGGFDSIENWALKEISDEIEISIDDLLSALPATPTTPKRMRFVPSSSATRPSSGSPAGTSRPGPAEASPSRASRVSCRPAARSNSPPDPSGLKRLRLSSSASASSVGSHRSAPRPRPQGDMTGPQARSPTAARQGLTVSIGARRSRGETISPSPSTRPGRGGPATTLTPRSISGPPRQLLARGTRPAVDRTATGSPGPTPSVTSVTTTKTARAAATTIATASTATSGAMQNEAGRSSQPASSAATRTSRPAVTDNASAGPSRLRATSASTTTSVRKPLTAKKDAPSRPPLLSSRVGGQTAQTRPNVTAKTESPVSQLRTANGSATTSVRSAAALINKAQAGPNRFTPAPGKLSTNPSRAAAVPTRPSSAASKTSTVGRASPAPSVAPSIKSKAPSIAPSVASRRTVTSRAVSQSTTSNTPLSQRATKTPTSKPSPPAKTISTTPTSPAKTATVSKTSVSVSSKPTTTPRLHTSASQSSLSTARSRLISAASTKSASSALAPKTLGKSLVLPAAPNPPSLHASKRSMRSPSASTDDTPEAHTPRLSHLASHPEPKILRDGSDVSDLALPSVSPLTKFPPSVPSTLSGMAMTMTMPRPARQVSNSSMRSNASLMRLHPASAFDPPRRVDVPLFTPFEPLALPPGVERFSGRKVELNVGIPCIVSLTSKRARFRGAIKYIGHLADSKGAWVGLEVDDLDRLDIPTLPSGSQNGIHYFHLTQPSPEEVDSHRQARRRRIEAIREGLRREPPNITLGRDQYNTGLGLMAATTKRSASPYIEFGGQAFENPRALFVRPSEIVFVMGAE